MVRLPFHESNLEDSACTPTLTLNDSFKNSECPGNVECLCKPQIGYDNWVPLARIQTALNNCRL